jgi:pimeloyl-ACP methyl ester carboxylesterase
MNPELETDTVTRRLDHSMNQLIVQVYIGVGILFTLASGWFLFNACTWVGRGVAIAGLILAILPAIFLARRFSQAHRTFWGWVSLALGVVLIGVVGAIIFTAPDGVASPDSPVSHRFTGATRFQRYALANIIPETEQMNLGLLLMPYLDAIFTVEQAQRVGPFTLELYQEMENDPHFHRLGSVLGWAYAEVVGLPFDVGHYYLYIPQNRSEGPLPAIVFLHGSLGNFKSYTWVWARFAEENGYVIIAPSFGFGNWLRPGGVEAVTRALDDAATVVELDPNRVYLAGISNGGLGVSRLAMASPEQFRGLIFLSPVMATEIVDSAEFLDTWRGCPVLVITGEVDRRIPFKYVTTRVSNLQAGGVEVTYITYPDEDHFLFFSQPASVLNDIVDWLSEHNH